jgi:hypothetical protein
LDADSQEGILIAWITHHLPELHSGGAEITDEAYREGMDVDVIKPSDWQAAMDYDKVVITGTDFIDPWAMSKLAKKKPAVLVHHAQTRTKHRALLINSSSVFICHTPSHLELELEWTEPKNSTWILSPHDPNEFHTAEKQEFALWAARWNEQKAPELAIDWAKARGLDLLMLYESNRQTVLEAMSKAKYFAFFPAGFDAEPRTIIEAVLSGCEVYTNDLAGITSVPGWDKPDILAELVSNSKQKFWETLGW